MRSPEKPGTELLQALSVRILQDAAITLSVKSSSINRDIVTLNTRVANEGLVFLTKTLPLLGKALDKCLSLDTPFELPSSFKGKKSEGYIIPEFLYDMFKLVLGPDGRPTERIGLQPMQIEAVRAIRQVCYLSYKLVGAHSKESEAVSLNNFVETDKLLEGLRLQDLSKSSKRALDNARLLIWFVLKSLDLSDIVPGHGPGAVATGEKPWEKMNFSRFYECIDEVYPYSDYFFYSYSHLCDNLQELEMLQTLPYGTAKLVMVPKDSRGPRLISSEPLEFQWLQQGIARKFMRHLEQASNVTGGYVNFTSQGINQELARRNSYHGDFITMDMKDASDRVSHALVEYLFPQHVFKYLNATRSQYTRLPDGTLVKLRKFAPMGSSVCFPVEALTFWALAVGSVVDVTSSRSLKGLPEVYVYGDDIVLRKEYCANVITVYEDLLLKVNNDKCCVGRFFRESCGVDAFMGVDVTPVKIRNADMTFSSPKSRLSWIAYANALATPARNYTSASNFLFQCIEASLGPLPLTNRSNGYPLARFDSAASWCDIVKSLTRFRRRFNKSLQRIEWRLPMPQPVTYYGGVAEGWYEMLRCLRKGPPDPFGFNYRSHLEPGTYAVPQRVKLGWAWLDITSLTL